MRTRGLWLPLLIIAVGVIALLANIGVLSSEALQRLGDLWPLVLVIIGLQLILNHTLERNQAAIIGLAATTAIVAGAVLYAALAPTTVLGEQHGHWSQRLTGASAATLELDYSASTVDVRTGGVGDNLYAAQVDYPGGENPPSVTLDQATATVTINDNGSFSGLHLFGSSQRHLTVNLSTQVPWTIRVSGGASRLNLDIPELQLNNLQISGGASTLDAQLGAAKGTVGVHISGGASNVTLHIPSGSQWSVAVSGGISSLTVDGQSSGGLGDFSRQSSGYSGANDRFDIRLTGGVSHLTLQTR